MKITKVLSFIFLFFGLFAFSQEDNLGRFNTDGINLEQESFLLSSIKLDQFALNKDRLVNEQNAIRIQQIGSYNQIYSQTKATSSNLELIQNGDSNDIEFFVNAPTYNGRVIQNGNNNSVLDNIYYTTQDVQLNVVQNGSNLSINRIGANTISNKLELIQQGSFKTITLISN